MSGKLPNPELEELRIVLVGRSGNGMTSVMNKILGKPAESEVSASSQTTQCKRETVELDGRKVVLIDTPGVLHTDKTEDEVKKDIMESITFAAPGPHVFLLVLKAGRFKTDDKLAVEIIQQIFGKESIKFTLALFTGTERHQPTDEEIQRSGLNSLINEHHSLEKEGQDERKQVSELMKKIIAMVEKNKREHYTNDMLKKAQEAIEKMKEEEKCESESGLITVLRKVSESFVKYVIGDQAELLKEWFDFLTPLAKKICSKVK